MLPVAEDVTEAFPQRMQLEFDESDVGFGGSDAGFVEAKVR